MADTKISALPASTTPLAGTEVLPIVQGGATVKVSVANLTAGRAVSATQITLTTGNLIVASGQGIDFSATPGTGTSELLADYEEGTWTPSQGAGVVLVGTFSSSGTYTRIGNVVTIAGRISGSTSVAISAGTLLCGDLPFSSGGGPIYNAGVATNDSLTTVGAIYPYFSSVYSTTISATPTIQFSVVFRIV